jgi:hypothetical protein
MPMRPLPPELSFGIYDCLNGVQSSRRLLREGARNIETTWLIGRLLLLDLIQRSSLLNDCNILTVKRTAKYCLLRVFAKWSFDAIVVSILRMWLRLVQLSLPLLGIAP